MPEIVQLLLGETSLQKGPRIYARRGVALKIDEVAGLIAVAGVEEVIEADLEQVARDE